MRSVIVFVAALIFSSATVSAEPVSIPAGYVTLTADLALPAGAGSHPVTIALHGCNGMRAQDGQRLNARHRDWNERLLATGYAVLALDSFSARGYTEICTKRGHGISPQVRADDVRAALTWIATQPVFDAKRVVLLGWSHGAMTVLWALRPGFLEGGIQPKAAIAYYPGCSEIAKLAGWKPTVPLTMLTGALDDWTPAAPCRELAARTGVRYIEYPGAYHAFDAPNAPVRLRTGLARPEGGVAHVGTNPEARAASLAEVITTLQRVAGPAGK